MKKVIRLLCIIIGIVNIARAQQVPAGYIDSLEQLVIEEKDSLGKANILGKLITLHVPNNFDKATEYAIRSVSVLPHSNKKSHARAFNTVGSLYAYQGKYEEALAYFDTSLTYSILIKDSSEIASTYGNIGSIHSDLGNQKKALKYIYLALDINETLQDSIQVTNSLNALLSIYIDQNEFDNALVVGKQIDDYQISETPVLDQSINAVNVGLAYKGLGELELALSSIKKGCLLAQKHQLYTIEAVAYRELANTYKDMNVKDSALFYADLALESIENLPSEVRVGMTYYIVAEVYRTFSNIEKSIQLYEKGLEYVRNGEHKKTLKDIYQGLAHAYAEVDNYQAAYKAQQKMTLLKDSILNETKQKQIEELEIQYETTKKEQYNQLLRKERDIERLKVERGQYWIIILGIVLTLVIVTSYFFFRTNRAKNEQRNTQLKHQLLRNQMNPHFIFNALIAIQSFMYKNDLRDASRYLSSFAKLVRAILENSRNEYITLDKEIQWLENYMSLQLLRFDNQFEYEIELDEEIDTYDCLIPPMLTQPFIENALEHGLKAIDYKGKIKVKFYQTANFLKIEVEDNGVGLEQSAKVNRNKKHESLATKITEERLMFLNKSSKIKIAIEVTNIEPSGTKVAFTVPIKYL
jgi:tetratricopeptide (TPR) repeat protein